MLLDHLTPILEKTQAERLRLDQIDNLVEITDTRIKENLLTPQEIEALEVEFQVISNNLNGNSDTPISNIETILGI